MKTPTRFIRRLTVSRLILVSVLGAFSPAMAQEESNPLRIEAVNLSAQDEGRIPDPETGASVSRPGDVIEYRLSFTNTSDGMLRDVVFNDPIPQGLVYVLESAGAERSDVVVEFSADGGAAYSQAPLIEITEGGQSVSRPAPPDLYTHVRWTIRETVAPGEEIRASFRARIAGELALKQ